jgi:hypothetical protein
MQDKAKRRLQNTDSDLVWTFAWPEPSKTALHFPKSIAKTKFNDAFIDSAHLSSFFFSQSHTNFIQHFRKWPISKSKYRLGMVLRLARVALRFSKLITKISMRDAFICTMYLLFSFFTIYSDSLSAFENVDKHDHARAGLVSNVYLSKIAVLALACYCMASNH